MQKMKNYVVNFVNNLVITLNNKEEGQRGPYPPDTLFEFNRTDDNVSVEADSKEEFHIEEEKKHRTIVM